MTGKFERSALRASLTYWLIAAGWVLLTNLAIVSIIPSRREIILFEMYKGWAFAAVASILLYLVFARETRRLEKESLEHARAEEALRRSELHLKAAQRLAHIGSWEWDSVDRKASWSDEMFRIFQIRPEDFTGDSTIVRERIHPDDLQRYFEVTDTSVREGEPLPHPVEFRIVLPDGQVRHLLSLNPLQHGDRADGVRMMGVVQDVTKWKTTEETLKLQASALQSAANAIIITDWSGTITFVNPAFTQLTGYSPDEVIGRNLRILKSGNQDPAFYKNLWDTITAGKVWRGHLVNRRKDGTLYDEEQTITPVMTGSGEISHFVAIKHDVTERIRAEAALRSSMDQMHELAARLESIREEERKSISHEVHDELGQALTAIKMDLVSLEESGFSDKEECEGKIGAAVLLLDDAMKTVRDIAARLRPGLLDYLGLLAAIEWQVEQFQRHSRIKCELKMPQSELAVDDERSTVLFRILQEALTNTARHAHAKRVEIDLSESSDEYVMSVKDDGVGILPEQIESPSSFGLLGIRERLYPFGGRCVIRRSTNGGTEIVVNLPKDKK